MFMPDRDFTQVERVLREAVPDVAPAAQLVVRWRGETVLDGAYGWLDPETRQRPTRPDTLFDLASVTKLFTVAAFMTLVEAGRVGLDQPVATVLPEAGGVRPIAPYEDPLQSGAMVRLVDEPAEVDAGQITFRHLLTHSAGLPAWRPLFKQGGADAARRMALTTACAYPIGARVIYSDIGLIQLGLAVERLAGVPLDQAVRERVTAPLGLGHTRYLPARQPTTDQRPTTNDQRQSGSSSLKPQVSFNIAPTEVCAWRGRRIAGEVHDENAAALGGVSGHAGMFSNAADVAAFGQVFLDGGRPLLRAATVAEMTRLQAEDAGVRRGLGFALWSPDPEASSNPFGPRTFGHTGFTGTSLWVDPSRELVVALLTNDVYYGRVRRGIAPLRVAAHHAIVEAIDTL
jgi:CubicO group peptidase (beta-lactamase class C family)